MSFITIGRKLAELRTPRAAVIPYTRKKGKLYFLLGQDKKSGDITDLGGGVKKFESTLAAALRELSEESINILGNLNPNDIKITRSIALLNKNMGTLFIPLSKDWIKKAPLLFDLKRIETTRKSHNEMQRLIWVPEEDFISIISGGFLEGEKQLWKKIRRFYYNGYNNQLREALLASVA